MMIRFIKGLVGKSRVVQSLCIGENGILLDMEGSVGWDTRICCIVATLEGNKAISLHTEDDAFNEIDKRIHWIIKHMKTSTVKRDKNFFIYGYFYLDQIEVLRKIAYKYDDYNFTFTLHYNEETQKGNQIIIETN